MKPGKTAMVINLAEFLPGDFTRNADFSLPTERLKRAIVGAAGAEQTHFIDASRARHRAVRQYASPPTCSCSATPISSARMPLVGGVDRAGDRAQRRGGGDEQGGVPLRPPRRRRPGRASRRCSSRRPETGSDAPPAVAVVRRDGRAPRRLPHRLPERRAMRARYRARVAKAKAAEAAKAPGRSGLAEAVARYLFKLMAYKDEYEVARLYTDGAFLQAGRDRIRRRQPALRVPSRAAAPGAAPIRDRRAAQDDVRPVDVARVRRAGEVQVPARHAARSVRLFGRSAGPSAS